MINVPFGSLINEHGMPLEHAEIRIVQSIRPIAHSSTSFKNVVRFLIRVRRIKLLTLYLATSSDGTHFSLPLTQHSRKLCVWKVLTLQAKNWWK